MNELTSSRNPWTFIPTLYFAEGLPYILINTVSVILYKRLGVDNASIAFWTSLLYLPWVVKMLWAPVVDLTSTKRSWVLWAQLAMAACLFAAALSLTSDAFFVLSLACFAAGAFISATHDIAVDGFYMLALPKDDQALFAGIRTTFYRLAMIFGTGALVYAAGAVEGMTGNVPASWTAVMLVPAGLFVAIAAYHKAALPFPVSDGARRSVEQKNGDSFVDVFVSYFRQERVWAVVAFILFYRFAEAMMLKLVAPFLLDPSTKGGLGLTTKQVGLVYGTVGMICLILGGIFGGWLISKYGFRRCIWPMAFALHVPDLVFVYLSYAQPPFPVVFPLVALEQFGYGLGFTAFTIFLMYAAEERYKTSHFAISTGIMALGMMVPGMVSGYLQEAVGYRVFFLVVIGMTVPGLLTVLFIPKE
jgi:PAT family beta-lactamase induction signal transducer AmpG